MSNVPLFGMEKLCKSFLALKEQLLVAAMVDSVSSFASAITADLPG